MQIENKVFSDVFETLLEIRIIIGVTFSDMVYNRECTYYCKTPYKELNVRPW